MRHDADAGLGALKVGVYVVTEHTDSAAGLIDQRGNHTDERGLAGAVGAEHGKEVAFSHIEVDALEGLNTILVGLGKTFNR